MKAGDWLAQTFDEYRFAAIYNANGQIRKHPTGARDDEIAEMLQPLASIDGVVLKGYHVHSYRQKIGLVGFRRPGCSKNSGVQTQAELAISDAPDTTKPTETFRRFYIGCPACGTDLLCLVKAIKPKFEKADEPGVASHRGIH